MLTTVMTKEVVTTREAFGVDAARNVAVIGDLGSSLLYMLALMTGEILRIEEPLATRALVRPLITPKMYLEVATWTGQCKIGHVHHVDSL
jgi:hypothetical protein